MGDTKQATLTLREAWIDVGGSLPELHKTVLVVVGGDYVHVGKRREDDWYLHTTGYAIESKAVTYWQEMLEPPVPKVLPCPFCGTSAEVYRISVSGDFQWRGCCKSLTCALTNGVNLDGTSRKEAVDTWNKRA